MPLSILSPLRTLLSLYVQDPPFSHPELQEGLRKLYQHSAAPLCAALCARPVAGGWHVSRSGTFGSDELHFYTSPNSPRENWGFIVPRDFDPIAAGLQHMLAVPELREFAQSALCDYLAVELLEETCIEISAPHDAGALRWHARWAGGEASRTHTLPLR